MTKEQTKQLLPIITAFAEGKEVQTQDVNNVWTTRDNLEFLNSPDYYRIKPEPREFYICIPCNACFTDEKEATRTAKLYNNTVIYVREVLDI